MGRLDATLFEEQKYLSENGMQALPLIVKAGNSTQCIRSVVFGEKQDAAGIRPFIAGV